MEAVAWQGEGVNVHIVETGGRVNVPSGSVTMNDQKATLSARMSEANAHGLTG